jgi:hypothetical protein
VTPSKILGLFVVIVYVVALKVLAILDIGSFSEHCLLLPILNSYFGIIHLRKAANPSEIQQQHIRLTEQKDIGKMISCPDIIFRTQLSRLGNVRNS